ncbi:D-alanyl-D-alanine carboxypeptidase [Candidatus Pelagibacter sp.]|nr:D-alanyl-D-alanine carboxypeptidase [Candidatus Pelagibacter sp.]
MNIKTLLKFILIFVFFHNLLKANIEVKVSTAILQDYLSGEILYEKDADAQIYPASMTKIMTTIIALDLIKKGELSLDEKFMISKNAWRLSNSGYSSMWIMVGDSVSVENLLKGIIIVSGNDACVALAEGIAGSEEQFAIMMTAKAKEIGMNNTNFTNASGIDHINNYSTVRDILTMSHYLIKNFPEGYKYFKEKEFTWDRTGGEPITQGNRNPLLYKNIGADGIKTGHLAVSKYSLAASIENNGRRLISVGSGFNTKNSRSKQSQNLLIWGLTNFSTINIGKQNEIFDSLEVWLGNKKKVDVHLKENIYKTSQKANKRNIKGIVEYNGPILAPIKKDQQVAKLKIFLKDKKIGEYNLYASENIDQVNIFSRILKSINYLIWGDV